MSTNERSRKPSGRSRGLPFALVLALAFGLVALAGVGLTLFLTQRGVTAALEAFHARQQQDALTQWLAEYYALYGSWDAVLRALNRPAALPRQLRMQLRHVPWALMDTQGWRLAGTVRTLPPTWERERHPVEVDGQVVGWLWMAPSPRARFATAAERLFLQQTRRSALVAAVVGLVVAVVLALLLAYGLTRPLHHVLHGLERVSRGELGIQVPVPRWQQEWARVVQAFNAMSQALARAEHLRKQMTEDLAHDLRTPISVLMGYLEGMKEGWIQPDSEVLDILHRETEYLQGMVADLRLLSLKDAGRLTLNKQMCLPAALAEEVVRRFRPQAEEKGIHLESRVEPNIPPWPMDPNAIRRVLDNLIKNALKYTPKGGRIAVHVFRRNEHLCMEVEDTGQGIPPEHLPYIFERFYRVDRARSSQAEGERSSGLGLAIAKALVEAHHGAITVESQPGRGTRFRFCIPYDEGKHRAIPQQEA